MSERVRKARALDAVEKLVDRCCGTAVESAKEAGSLQLLLKYDISGAVGEAAEIYGVDRDWLEREAWAMLGNGLNSSLRPICEVRYVKAHQRDGKTVGMEAKVYKFRGKVA